MNRTLSISTASRLGSALARKVVSEGSSILSSLPIHLNGYRSKNRSSASLLTQIGDDQARS